MKTIEQLRTEITTLTSKIIEDYPELYKYLEENPLTLSLGPHPKVDGKSLKDYLQSLQQLLEHHVGTHHNLNHIENG